MSTYFDYEAKTYYFDKTLDLGKVVGVRFEGAGQAYYPSDHPWDGEVTRLVWMGDPDEPMIRGHIRHGVFQDIQFVNGWIHIDPTRGLGTGLCQFERCTFFGDSAGVKFGNEKYNGNAADSKFRDCQFVNCENPIEITSSQNVNYVIDGCMFYRCDRVMNVLGGGLVTVQNCYLTKVPEVFTVRGDGSKTGRQNGNFVVRDLRYDANQIGEVTIAKDVSTYGWRKLVIDNVHAPPQGVLDVYTSKAHWEIDRI